MFKERIEIIQRTSCLLSRRTVTLLKSWALKKDKVKKTSKFPFHNRSNGQWRLRSWQRWVDTHNDRGTGRALALWVVLKVIPENLNSGSQVRVTKRRFICSERQGWKIISETSLYVWRLICFLDSQQNAVVGMCEDEDLKVSEIWTEEGSWMLMMVCRSEHQHFHTA